MTTETKARQCACIGPLNCGRTGSPPTIKEGGTVMYGEYHTERACIASDCLAWRWSYKRKTVMTYNGDRLEELKPEEWSGYCGLAGPDKFDTCIETRFDKESQSS